MGLYDNVHAINSTRVPTFVEDHSKEIGNYIDNMNQRHELTGALIDKTKESLRTLQYRTQDKEAYDALLEQAQGEISNIAQRPDLANAAGDAYKLATQVASRIGDLSNNYSRDMAWRKEVDDLVEKGKIDATTRDRYLNYSNEINGPLKYDLKTGRAINQFSPISITANVDKTERLKKFLDLIPENEWKKVIGSDDGTVETKDRWAYKDKLPDTIKQQFDAWIRTEPDWSAMNARDARFAMMENTKGVSDAAVLMQLQKPPANQAEAIWQKDMQTAMENGAKSPVEALRDVTYRYELNSLYNNDLQVALGGSKHDQDTEHTTGPGYVAQANAKAKAEAGTDVNFALQGATIGVPEWGKTGQEIADTHNKLEEEHAATVRDLDKITKLLDSGKVVGDERVNMTSQQIELMTQEALQKDQIQRVTKARNNIRNTVARELTDGHYNYTDLVDEKTKDVNKNLQVIGIKDGISLGGIYLKRNAIARAMAEGKYTPGTEKLVPVPGTTRDRIEKTPPTLSINGTQVTIPKDLEDEFNYMNKWNGDSRQKFLNDIEAGMKTRAVAQTDLKNSATTIPSPILKKFREAPAILSTMNILDLKGKQVLNTDLQDVDWKKSVETLGTLNEQSETMPITLYDSEGKVKGTYLADATGAGIKYEIAKSYLKTSDPTLQNLGRRMLYNNDKVYLKAFSGANGVTKHPVSEQYMKLGDVPIVASRNTDGTFSISTFAPDANGNNKGGYPIPIDGAPGKVASHMNFSDFTNQMNYILEQQLKAEK